MRPDDQPTSPAPDQDAVTNDTNPAASEPTPEQSPPQDIPGADQNNVFTSLAWKGTIVDAILVIACALAAKWLAVQAYDRGTAYVWLALWGQLPKEMPTLVTVGQNILPNLVGIIVLLRVRSPRNLGLGDRTRLFGSLRTAHVGWLVVLLVLIVGMGGEFFATCIMADQQGEDLVRLFSRALPWVLVGSVMEELLYTGGIYPFLRMGLLSFVGKRMPPFLTETIAIIVQGAIFLVAHHVYSTQARTVADDIGLFASACGSAVLYRFSKWLWIPILTHIGWNMTVLLRQMF